MIIHFFQKVNGNYKNPPPWGDLFFNYFFKTTKTTGVYLGIKKTE